MKISSMCASIVGLLLCASAHAGVQYVSGEPLTKVVKDSARPVQTGSEVKLPIITWGGDIATILANGNAVSTASDGMFAEQGLRFKLIKEDNFPKQLGAYIRGESPYLRGTMGMINMSADLWANNPSAKPVVIYQLTWSAGGDALVVKPGIKTVADLKGKTIALQAYGPHVDYLTQVLSDAHLSISDVTIKWTKDLTGSSETPAEAMRTDSSIDAAFVISPDAMALTSNGTVGTGAEQSAKGATILLTTKTANRIIGDVYAVRTDYFESHRADVEKFVHCLLKAEELLRSIMKDQEQNRDLHNQTVAAAASILLDDAKATADVVGLYGDCEYVGYQGNVMFFANPTYPRRFSELTKQIQTAFVSLGLLRAPVAIASAGLDYEALKSGLVNTAAVVAPRFDEAQVSKVIGQRAEQGTLDQGSLIQFEILFKPGQTTFDENTYQAQFDQVIKLVSTYGGAIITVEGHADPLEYLRKKKDGESEVILTKFRQSAKNLSLNRSSAVRDSIVAYATKKGITLDPSQFASIGHGISQPKTGLVGSEPIAPANQQEWLSNMRVVFRMVNVEAEQSVFKPL